MVYVMIGILWCVGFMIVGIIVQLDEELENLVFLELEKLILYELGFKL